MMEEYNKTIELITELERLRDSIRGYHVTVGELREENQAMIKSLARARDFIRALGIMAREIAED
jgi:hypothetical protein